MHISINITVVYVTICGWMADWMVGWMVGWKAGWMDGRMDGWIAFSIQSDLFWVGDMSVSRFKWYPKTIRIVKWRFPEMGVPPSHLF